MGEDDIPAKEVGWKYPLLCQIRDATCSLEYTLEKGRNKPPTWLPETEA